MKAIRTGTGSGIRRAIDHGVSGAIGREDLHDPRPRRVDRRPGGEPEPRRSTLRTTRPPRGMTAVRPGLQLSFIMGRCAMETMGRSAGYARSCWTVLIRRAWLASGPACSAGSRSSGIRAGSRLSRPRMVSGCRSRVPVPGPVPQPGAGRARWCISTFWSAISPLLTNGLSPRVGSSPGSTSRPVVAPAGSWCGGAFTGTPQATHSVS